MENKKLSLKANNYLFKNKKKNTLKKLNKTSFVLKLKKN